MNRSRSGRVGRIVVIAAGAGLAVGLLLNALGVVDALAVGLIGGAVGGGIGGLIAARASPPDHGSQENQG